MHNFATEDTVADISTLVLLGHVQTCYCGSGEAVLLVCEQMFLKSSKEIFLKCSPHIHLVSAVAGPALKHDHCPRNFVKVLGFSLLYHMDSSALSHTICLCSV